MTDSPKPPAELTAPASAPALAATDSAPPPTPSPAPLPPRNYSSGPVVIAPPARYAPNSTVPRFLKLLAALILVGGTMSAAAAWVYRTVIYPRLVVALRARTQLFATHEKAYLRFVEKLTGLVTGGKGVERLGGKEAIKFRRKLKEDGAEEGQEGPASAARAGEKAKEAGVAASEGQPPAYTPEDPAASEPAPRPLPPPPQLLAPVHSSLSSLSSTLRSASPSISSTTGHSSRNPSNLVQPTGTLLRALVTFNEYLESEGYAASTFHSYSGRGLYSAGSMGGGQQEGERKKLQQATGDVKAEIRSIKGALLNRRNFVRPEAASAA
ncbi:hypothetical protein JCM8097_003170 [Rhodosporidiobolus ruineniae]